MTFLLVFLEFVWLYMAIKSIYSKKDVLSKAVFVFPWEPIAQWLLLIYYHLFHSSQSPEYYDLTPSFYCYAQCPCSLHLTYSLLPTFICLFAHYNSGGCCEKSVHDLPISINPLSEGTAGFIFNCLSNICKAGLETRTTIPI